MTLEEFLASEIVWRWTHDHEVLGQITIGVVRRDAQYRVVVRHTEKIIDSSGIDDLGEAIERARLAAAFHLSGRLQ
jgi:hypothetical protein